MSLFDPENDCDFPFWMEIVMTGYVMSFLFLFANFYLYTYIIKSRPSAKKTD
jgi:hypothetical protein